MTRSNDYRAIPTKPSPLAYGSSTAETIAPAYLEAPRQGPQAAIRHVIADALTSCVRPSGARCGAVV